MLKPANWLIVSAFLITLEIYRVPTPIGLSMSLSHFSLGIALFLIGFDFLSGRAKIEISKETKLLMIVLGLFALDGAVSFLRNLNVMKPETMSGYFSELVGYALVFSIPFSVARPCLLNKLLKAFVAASSFIYLGMCLHLYSYYVRGQLIFGTPFWHNYTRSKHVAEYMSSASNFYGFPRFTLPFSSPAGTGMFLSFVGIILLSLTLYRIVRKKDWLWLHVLNLLNFFCLLGTFARASWAVFIVGMAATIWHFRKLIKAKDLVRPAVVSALFFILLGMTPVGAELYRLVWLRFTPKATAQSNAGHLESRVLAIKYSIENPVSGLGVGGFFLKPEGELHTHSTYFTLLVERGIVGLFLYLAFLYALLSALRKRVLLFESNIGDGSFPYAVGFTGCLLGLLVGNFLYEMSSEGLWLLFGIMMGYVNLSPSEHKFEVLTQPGFLRRI